MVAEENETPGGDPDAGGAQSAGRGQPAGLGGEGRARRTEGDLLAERRSRRAAETGEAALTLRAEAAEATVQTLERHVASLQQRLREAELERLGVAELLETEKALVLEQEHEVRGAKQREYAEQQLRVEVEERLLGLDRDSRTEVERLARRLSASDEDARDLGERLERVQRQLAEAEQQAAAERSDVRRGELELQERLGQLEQRASQMQLGLERERAARERSERLLESMRHGHRQVEHLVGDMKGLVERLLAFSERLPPALAPAPEPAPELHGAEMADALAAAVERLRARAQETPRGPEESPGGSDVAFGSAVSRPPHRHSMSLVRRMRIRRKQRRER